MRPPRRQRPGTPRRPPPRTAQRRGPREPRRGRARRPGPPPLRATPDRRPARRRPGAPRPSPRPTTTRGNAASPRGAATRPAGGPGPPPRPRVRPRRPRLRPRPSSRDSAPRPSAGARRTRRSAFGRSPSSPTAGSPTCLRERRGTAPAACRSEAPSPPPPSRGRRSGRLPCSGSAGAQARPTRGSGRPSAPRRPTRASLNPRRHHPLRHRQNRACGDPGRRPVAVTAGARAGRSGNPVSGRGLSASARRGPRAGAPAPERGRPPRRSPAGWFGSCAPGAAAAASGAVPQVHGSIVLEAPTGSLTLRNVRSSA